MILIDEPMPTGCAECFFSTGCNACEGFIDKCTLTGKQFKVKDYGTVYPDPRPDWCPLMEIVHCKDCKHSHRTYDGMIKLCDLIKDENDMMIELYRSGDWYCADGERSE